MKQYIYYLYAILLMVLGNDLCGQPSPLPTADKYVVNKKFDVNVMGVNESIDQRYIAYFCDDITLENFNLAYEKWGGGMDPGKCKDVIIIANVLRLGRDNYITLESFAGNEFEKEGGSIIFICRKLVINEDANLRFTGTTGFPFVTTFGDAGTTNYQGAYGSGLYIAAEELVIEDAKYNKIRNSYLTGWNWRLENMKGYTISKEEGGGNPYATQNQNPYSMLTDHQNKIFSPMEVMGLYNKYKNIMSPEDNLKFLKLLEEEKLDDPLISMLNYLYAMSYDDQTPMERLTSLFSFYGAHNSAINLGPFTNICVFTNQKALKPKNAPYVDFNIEYGIPINVELSGEYIEKIKTLTGQQIIDVRGNSVIGTLINKNIYSKISTEHKKLFSMWSVEWIEYLYNEIQSAKLLSNQAQFFKLLKRVIEMPRYPLEPPYNNRYFETYKKILLLLNEAQNMVVTDQIVIGAPYEGKVLPFLKKGLPEKMYATPTDLLLNGIKDRDGYKYGVLELIDGPDKIYKLKLTAELIVDPVTITALNSALETKYSKNIEKGFIAGIQYELKLVNSELINTSNINVAGSLVSLTLNITQEQLAATMFQLVTSGLPFKLKWLLPGAPNQSGDLADVRLRLNKRLGNDLLIDGLNINNPTTSKVNIAYLKTTSGRIIFLKDVYIDKQSTYNISSNFLNPGESIAEIPDLSVSFDDGSFEQTINRFLQLESNMIVENVIIKNNIPVAITRPGSELSLQVQSVDINIELMSDGGDSGIMIFHKLLSPYGSFGSQSNTSTPRIAVQLNKYRVSGKVNFTDGGSVLLKNRIFDGSQLNITLNDIFFQ